MGDLARFFHPGSIAVVGGGAWCAAVIEQCRKIGFPGPVWAVHPTRTEVGNVAAVPSISGLPGVPDAVFIGVNRHATIETVAALSAIGAGGAVCFASGFAESGDGELGDALLTAAGDMPILGPNCYGFINYLDRAALWPDQHGGTPVESGVAILTQSSNLAINLTMQRRGLPLAFIATAGNQSQRGIAEIGRALLGDPRITALGLHIEGFGNIRALEALAAEARDLGKRIVALKIGTSDQARSATVSHTASISGSNAGAHALLARLGIARVDTLSEYLEALKIAHVHGPLQGTRIASLSCSGGEAALMADAGMTAGVEFPPLTGQQKSSLAKTLGPLVILSNPLDYHTFIWRNGAALSHVFAAMTGPGLDLTAIVLDFPRPDRCDLADWQIAVAAIEKAAKETQRPFAVVTSLAENMPEEIAQRFLENGIVPLFGIEDAMTAIRAAAMPAADNEGRVLLTGRSNASVTLAEDAAKAALSRYGVVVPNSAAAKMPEDAAEALGFPVVLKGEGMAHKSEAGCVVLGLADRAAVRKAANAMPATSFLVEEMVTGGVADVLIGVVHDPAHGFVLTLAAGGVLTELMSDRANLLIPARRAAIEAALRVLPLARLLDGYRGAPAGSWTTLLDMVMALQDYVLAEAEGLAEVELNPVIVTPERSVAVDALIRRDPGTGGGS